MKKNIIISSLVAITAIIVGVIAWLPTTQAQSTTSYDVSGYAFSDMPNSADQQVTVINNYGGRGLGKIEMSGADYQVKLSSTGQFSGYAWNGFGGYASFSGVSVQSACLTNPDSICDVAGDFVFIAAQNAPITVSGGWDGIVRTNGAWDKPVKLGKVVNGVRTMSGFAWGGDVVGWVDFSNVTVAVGVLGCTDSAASNYNENATIDDGTCITDATCPDGSIIPNGDVNQCPVSPPLCPDGTPVPPGGCSGGGCPAPANYPGMNGYNNICACVARAGYPSDCPTAGCKISGDPFYNTSATTTNNSMCFCPSGNYNASTGACGSCPNPNYPKMSSGYDNTCRCIPRPGQPNDCPTGTKWPGYVEI